MSLRLSDGFGAAAGALAARHSAAGCAGRSFRQRTPTATSPTMAAGMSEEGLRHKAEVSLPEPGQFCPVSSPTQLPSNCTKPRRPSGRQGWPWQLGDLPEACPLRPCQCPQC